MAHTTFSPLLLSEYGHQGNEMSGCSAPETMAQNSPMCPVHRRFPIPYLYITHQHIRPFAVNYVTNQSQCLLRMGRQVWRNDLSPSLECLPQCQRWLALPAGKESVQEQYLDLRSSFLPLSRVDASITLPSLNRNLLHKLS